jgi:hypothetical protein
LKTTILSAPQGWGKSSNAAALQAEFGCSMLIDDWHPGQNIWPNALHLTNAQAEEITATTPPDQQIRVVERGW